jgi:peptidoglycan/LPS O-acetylase OafA/YrhL
MGLLRFLLSLSVLSAHTGSIFGSNLIGGKMAVQAFFILSGFYMAFVLNQKYSKKKHAYKLFLTNRFFRIYPTYWAILFLSLITSFVFFYQEADTKVHIYEEYKQALNPLTFGYLMFVQIFIIGMDWIMFMGINTTHGTFFLSNNYLTTQPLLYDFLFIPQAWTLSLELIFYSIAPFLVKRNNLFLIFLSLFSILLRFYLYSIGLHHEPWTNRFFPTELVFFVLGILSYRIYEYLPIKKSFLISVSFLILLVTITIFYNFIPYHNGYFLDISQEGYFGLLFFGIPFIFTLTKNNMLDRFIGLLSYPIYISHLFIVDLLHHLDQKWSPQFFTIITVLITLLLSIILIFVIEKPIERYRQRRLTSKKTK